MSYKPKSQAERRFLEEHPRVERTRWIPAHKAEIQGITVEDWQNLALAIISMKSRIANSDDMAAVLRSIKWDSRIKEPNKIRMEHLRIALTMIQMGRVDQQVCSDG